MTRPIRQSVTLAAPAASLYRMYLNAKTHAAITGGKVVVSARRGGTNGWKKYYWGPWRRYFKR